MTPQIGHDVVEILRDEVRQHESIVQVRAPSNERLIERSQGARTTLTPLFHQPVIGLEVLEALELLAGRQGWTCGTRR